MNLQPICYLIHPLIQDYDTEDIDFMKMAILDKWDLNKDGRINKSELSMLLLQQSMMSQRSQSSDGGEEWSSHWITQAEMGHIG